MSVLRIRDVYPGSRILIFTHSGSRIQKQQQKRGATNNSCQTFFGSHKFHKIENYFSFEVLKKKIWANFQRIIELFTPKIVTKLSKIWVWNPGSRGQKGTGSRIPDPQHWFSPRMFYLSLSVLRGTVRLCLVLLLLPLDRLAHLQHHARQQGKGTNRQPTSACWLCSSVVINYSVMINKNLLIHNTVC
jgi:hypothetical protein